MKSSSSLVLLCLLPLGLLLRFEALEQRDVPWAEGIPKLYVSDVHSVCKGMSDTATGWKGCELLTMIVLLLKMKR